MCHDLSFTTRESHSVTGEVNLTEIRDSWVLIRAQAYRLQVIYFRFIKKHIGNESELWLGMIWKRTEGIIPQNIHSCVLEAESREVF